MNQNETPEAAEADLREETAAEAPELEANDRLAELEEALADAKQQILYAQAETQNVRRRAEVEAKNARDYGSTSFARDMLSIADNVSRAMDAISTDLRGDDKFKGLVAGLEATTRELDAVFARNGITRIEAVGQPLDPNKHQAMMEMPTSDAEPGTVVQEIQAGYMIKDRLLRPALVGVAKAG